MKNKTGFVVTRAGFVQWLKSLPQDETFGSQFPNAINELECNCPLEQYVACEKYGHPDKVCNIYEEAAPGDSLIPDEIQAIICNIDIGAARTSKRDYWRELTPSDCLRLIRA